MSTPPTMRPPACRLCDHARYTPAPGKVGCELLSAMTPIQVLRAGAAELHRLWRGRVHATTYPDALETPTDGFSDKHVLVPATDHCSRFRPRLRVA